MRSGLLKTLVAVSSVSFASAATICNGYAELCSKSYSAVSVVGAHNSYTNSPTNLAANQDYDVTQQLTDGIRLLQNQVHLNGGVLQLCHTSCQLYKGDTLQDYLTKVKTWMDSNPTEVVTILLVNINNQPASSFDTIYKAVGLDALAYVPPQAVIPTNAWPDLGTMIDAGTRLVTFMDNTADFASVPYIIDEFSNMWETPYDDQKGDFPCTIDRFTGDTANQMFLINHYLYTTSNLFGGSTPVPDKAKLNITNAVTGPGSLGEETETCKTAHGRYPTFLLVDFYNYGEGSVFQVAASLNGVPYDTSKVIAPPNPPASSAGSTSTSRSSSRPNGALAGAVMDKSSVVGGIMVVGGALLGSLLVI